MRNPRSNKTDPTEMAELIAWLGDTAKQLAPEQITQLAVHRAAIARRHPDRLNCTIEQARIRDAALMAALEWMLGERPLDQVARDLRAARLESRCAFAAAEQIAVMLVDRGESVLGSAQACGIHRSSLITCLKSL